MSQSRKIVITKCEECPRVGHAGAFGRVAYIPRCGAANKELPYTIGNNRKTLVAITTTEIPEWCPLELNEAQQS